MTLSPTFAPATEFKHALETGVDEYFRRAGISKTGNFGMYLKAVLLLLGSPVHTTYWFSMSPIGLAASWPACLSPWP